jgi:hypothetical protein
MGSISSPASAPRAPEPGRQCAHHQGERRKPGGSDQQAELEPQQNVLRQLHHRRRRDRRQHQRRPEAQPMPGKLRKGDRLLADAAHRKLIEDPARAVRLHQPLHRQQGREQGRHPQGPSPVRASSGRSGPTAKGKSVATSRKKTIGSSALPPAAASRSSRHTRFLTPAPA